MARIIDLTGKRFGRLLVLMQTDEVRWGQRVWLCACKCGNTKEVDGSSLKRGFTKSCGCINKSHGLHHTREYAVWCDIRQRCSNKNLRCYKHYGARGIKMCKRWNKFKTFIEDMGMRPSKSHTIERINNNKGYSPSNCKWATYSEQNRNNRRTRLLRYNGRTMCAKDWAREINMGYTTFLWHCKNGKSVSQIIDLLNG